MTIWERLDVVREQLEGLADHSWPWVYWNQVYAELLRKALRP